MREHNVLVIIVDPDGALVVNRSRKRGISVPSTYAHRVVFHDMIVGNISADKTPVWKKKRLIRRSVGAIRVPSVEDHGRASIMCARSADAGTPSYHRGHSVGCIRCSTSSPSRAFRSTCIRRISDIFGKRDWGMRITRRCKSIMHSRKKSGGTRWQRRSPLCSEQSMPALPCPIRKNIIWRAPSIVPTGIVIVM